MSKVKNENFIAIQGWMVSELGLKGNSLLIYAIIYGFSQAEGQVFSGSLQYLADWTNSTRQGALRILKNLIEAGLIIKKEKIVNGVKFCEYCCQNVNRVLTKCEQGVNKMLTNNIEDNIEDNIDTIPKGIEKTPEKYGNPEINELFDEWEKHCGFKIDTKVKQNRYACQRLLRSRGFERVKNVIPYVVESQADQYAPGINNFMDLAEKWNNLAVWYKKKKVTNTMKYGKIVIPTTNERNK